MKIGRGSRGGGKYLKTRHRGSPPIRVLAKRLEGKKNETGQYVTRQRKNIRNHRAKKRLGTQQPPTEKDSKGKRMAVERRSMEVKREPSFTRAWPARGKKEWGKKGSNRCGRSDPNMVLDWAVSKQGEVRGKKGLVFSKNNWGRKAKDSASRNWERTKHKRFSTRRSGNADGESRGGHL